MLIGKIKVRKEIKMRENGKKLVKVGITSIVLFVIWTCLIQLVDVQQIGPKGSKVGFASWNGWVFNLTGVHMEIYNITDWLSLIPIFVCLGFAGLGLWQFIKRKSLFRVDYDILLLGIYYIFVIMGYLMFEMIPINYRPVLIEGVLETSYPSSTTLLVLSVMPTLVFQVRRRVENVTVKTVMCLVTILFSAGMVIGRLISGVHWFTDIVGGIMLSTGLYSMYKASVYLCQKEEK